MREAEAMALLLLPLPRFVVLEPVKHVFAFDFAVFPELRRDLLDLLSVWSSHSASVQHFQYSYLFLRRIPPRSARLTCLRRLYPPCTLNFQLPFSHVYISQFYCNILSNKVAHQFCIFYFFPTTKYISNEMP